jgi:hypothetical protein
MTPPAFTHRADARLRPGRILFGFTLVALLAAAGALFQPAGATGTQPAAPAGTALAAADSTSQAHRILAYYFHTTQRCATCRKIEAYTAEAIQTGFPEELKAGRLVFRTLNVDEPDNKHFLKDYKLFTKSVVLVDEQPGRQSAWKNLPKIWELIGDKEKFVRYIQDETRSYLAGTKP